MITELILVLQALHKAGLSEISQLCTRQHFTTSIEQSCHSITNCSTFHALGSLCHKMFPLLFKLFKITYTQQTCISHRKEKPMRKKQRRFTIHCKYLCYGNTEKRKKKKKKHQVMKQIKSSRVKTNHELGSLIVQEWDWHQANSRNISI